MQTKPSAQESEANGEFQSFVADVEDLVKATTSDESIEGIGSAISGHARTAAKGADKFVRENPWQAIAIGAALGLLLGVTLARRK